MLDPCHTKHEFSQVNQPKQPQQQQKVVQNELKIEEFLKSKEKEKPQVNLLEQREPIKGK